MQNMLNNVKKDKRSTYPGSNIEGVFKQYIKIIFIFRNFQGLLPRPGMQ